MGSLNVNVIEKRNCLIVCLFGVLSSTRELFYPFEDITITGEGVKFWHARRSWPLSTEGFQTCHTNCRTGQSFFYVLIRGPVTLTLIALAFGNGAIAICLNDLGLSHPWIEPPTSIRVERYITNPPQRLKRHCNARMKWTFW